MEALTNSEIEKLKLKLKNAEDYNHYLTDLYDDIRGFKHDFDNIMNCINGYIELNDITGLKKYFSQFERHISKVKTSGLINPKIINDPGIFSLIASKYEKAQNLNINFNIDIFFDFSKILMPIYEFSKILGILLDNAIEATKECKKKEINISFREIKKEKIQIISIENTYLNDNLDKNSIFNKGTSSKENHSGIGLWEVKKIVDSHPNVFLSTNFDRKYFNQELQIKKDYTIVE